jgi:hypothetical protein
VTPPKQQNHTFHMVPSACISYPILPSHFPQVFGWLLRIKLLTISCLRPACILLMLFYPCLILRSKQLDGASPRAFTPTPPYHSRLLSDSLCSWIIKQQPPKANIHPTTLILDAVDFVGLNDGSRKWESKPNAICMLRTHREPRCNDFGAWWIFCRKLRSKPLGSWVAASHLMFCVVCCVLVWPWILFQPGGIVSVNTWTEF